MRIGVDVRIFAKGPHTGVGVFTREVLQALFRNFPQEQFLLSSSSVRPLSPWLANFSSFSHVSAYHLVIPNRVLDQSLRFLKYPKLDELLGGVDVWLSPHMLLTPLARAPRVLVIHDLSFVRFPEFYSFVPRGHRLWHWMMNPAHQARSAQRLIALSHSTAQDLIHMWNIPQEHIRVVYPGIPGGTVLAREDAAAVAFRNTHDLPRSYIGYLGELAPRKNILGILRAFELLGQKPGHRDRVLALAGPWGWRREEVEHTIGRSPVKNQIRILGYISDTDKPPFYAGMDAFVYPSFFEGFGFPPLEAMQAGVPVIVSNRGALPESAGPAALMVDPYKPEELAEAMGQILEDAALRKNLIAKGKAHAAQFSWDKAAREVMAVLRDAAKNRA